MNLLRANRPANGLTAMDVIVVVAMIVLLTAVLLPHFAAHKRRGGPWCVNNLAQIGLACRIWAEDHRGKYPFHVSVTNGGSMELKTVGNGWLNFLVMSNELATPKLLVCPQDANHRPSATNFSSQLTGHISYFVGLDAQESDPRSIVSGDDNFRIGGVPVKAGLHEISMNKSILWQRDRHGPVGNILLGDGSVNTFGNHDGDDGIGRVFRQTGIATNHIAVP